MEAVIFDMDGVLVDSVAHWQDERHRVIVDELGLEDVDVDDLVGMNTHDEYDILAEQYEMDVPQSEYVDRLSENAMAIYRERVEPLSGLDTLLESLEQQGVTIALATSTYRRRAEVVLQRFQIEEMFEAIVTADDVEGPSKPAPDIYRQTASTLDVDPDQCIAVEDSRNGVIAANRAGMYSIGYDAPEGPSQDLDPADEVVSNPPELADRLIDIAEGEQQPYSAETTG